jgi:hypothetical protein
VRHRGKCVRSLQPNHIHELTELVSTFTIDRPSTLSTSRLTQTVPGSAGSSPARWQRMAPDSGYVDPGRQSANTTDLSMKVNTVPAASVNCASTRPGCGSSSTQRVTTHGTSNQVSWTPSDPT